MTEQPKDGGPAFPNYGLYMGIDGNPSFHFGQGWVL